MADEKPPNVPLIFPCSGGSDTGSIVDRAARNLSRSGIAKMYCLAGIGAQVEQIVNNTDAAEQLIALDGCENDCSRKMLEVAGFTPALHLRLNDLGMEKGNTPPTDDRVRTVTEEIRRRLFDQEE